MAPLRNKSLLLYCVRVLWAYPVVYINKFLQKLLYFNTSMILYDLTWCGEGGVFESPTLKLLQYLMFPFEKIPLEICGIIENNNIFCDTLTVIPAFYIPDNNSTNS